MGEKCDLPLLGRLTYEWPWLGSLSLTLLRNRYVEGRASEDRSVSGSGASKIL